ncbi:hypothetical protein BS78_05G042900 [Paspalum vaginatum]|nr:hypothetical protein BS78_05G042900 [Paspalum vaginatum]
MGNSSSRGRSKPGQGHGSKHGGFSSLLDKGEGWTYSRVFEAMGHNWYLKLNLRDKKSGSDKEYVSLRLELASSSVKPDTVVDASFKLMIYDQSHRFQTASTSSGASCMISHRKLKKRPSKFLVNNCCVFGVEFVKVTASKANMTLETLFVKKTSIFNEAGTYTWYIDDFFALKNPGYSPEFQVGGYKWYITMYPSRDGNHLLYLKLKKTTDIPKDTTNLVELTLSIKDQETGKHKKRIGFPTWKKFFHWTEFAKDTRIWGWSKFISLEDFKDSANGYLVKTKCCIAAEVTIIGSSKKE